MTRFKDLEHKLPGFGELCPYCRKSKMIKIGRETFGGPIRFDDLVKKMMNFNPQYIYLRCPDCGFEQAGE
jgi:hypothetical protein